MNKVTLDVLWKHLNDKISDNKIKRNNVIDVLQFSATLYVAFRYRIKGYKNKPEIKKKKLRNQIIPVSQWILNNKMINDNDAVTKEEFQQKFGNWLIQYNNNIL